jgi:hypothetical protein
MTFWIASSKVSPHSQADTHYRQGEDTNSTSIMIPINNGRHQNKP